MDPSALMNVIEHQDNDSDFCLSKEAMCAAQCACYLLFAKKMCSSALKTSIERCNRYFEATVIPTFESKCDPYVTNGMIRFAELSEMITSIIHRCTDRMAPEVVYSKC